jgi:hypothetical protein
VTCPNGYNSYRNECVFNMPNCDTNASCSSTISGKCYVNISGVPPGCEVCSNGRKLDIYYGATAYCNKGTTQLCSSTSGQGVGGYCAACPYGKVGYGLAYCVVPDRSCASKSAYISSMVEGTIPVCSYCPENSNGKSDWSGCDLCPPGKFTVTYFLKNGTWASLHTTNSECQYPQYPQNTVMKTLNNVSYAYVQMWLDASHTYAQINGTATGCATKCNTDSGCTGFSRLLNVSDTVVSTCYFTKSIHNNILFSSGTVKWSSTYRSFIRV